MACDASRAILSSDDALSPFRFLLIPVSLDIPLSNESPHLFAAPTHPPLLLLQPQPPSSQPQCLLMLVLLFWPSLTNGTCPCPLQLLDCWTLHAKRKHPRFLAWYRYYASWILWKNFCASMAAFPTTLGETKGSQWVYEAENKTVLAHLQS